MPVTIIGATEVARQFDSLKQSANYSQGKFLDAIATTTIDLLRQNTPKDTGALSNSWQVARRTYTTLLIGVTPDQVDKLVYVVFGTRYIQPKDFITPILNNIADNIDSVMRFYLKQSHPYLSQMQVTGGFRGIKTPSNVVGLTGTRVHKRRYRGVNALKPLHTGIPRLGNRITRRRTV